MGKINLSFFLLVLLVLAPLPLRAGQAVIIPEPLQPWTDWVLHGHETELLCTPEYDNAASLNCSWPSRLGLDLNGRGGRFRQEWQVRNEGWLELPGSESYWPAAVKLDDRPVPLLNHQGRPAVWLKGGKHTLSGSFTWPSLPVYLTVPAHSGLVDLKIDGRVVVTPLLDEQGRLWLKSGATGEEKVENRLNLQVFRLIDDRIPARLITSLDLDVAGIAREVTLGPIFAPDAFKPLALQSPLPARLESDGRLRVQIRPGRWHLNVTGRHLGPLKELTDNHPDDGFWPGEEIWSFAAHTNLRIVEIEGVPAVDPQQTSLPSEWRQYPAYRLTAGETMRFKEIKRGDPQPAPDQLSLARTLWLRFDGSGYTIQDTISGRKNTGWRLEMNPPLALGRVVVNGREQFITKRKDAAGSGVELREGNLNLVADSVYRGNISRLPAVGWNHDFQQLKASLMLPPGWLLIHAAGIDRVSTSWLNRWTLLDIFIVLIITLAVAHLYSRRLALLAFLTLVLTWHEPQAPRWIWPLLLTGFALLKYLPEGGFKKLVRWGQALLLLVYLIITIPFAIVQLRVGIYPQLEKPWQAMAHVQGQPAAPAGLKSPAPTLEEKGIENETLSSRSQVLRKKAEIAMGTVSSLAGDYAEPYEYDASRVAQYDPKMQLQTGPGLPAWQWNTVVLDWSGPVRAGQTISLWLLGPIANLVLAVARVLLLILLPLGLLGIGYRRGSGWRLETVRRLFTLGLLLMLLTLPSLGRAADFPTPEMLAELQSRLLEKDKCFPDCAALEQLDLNLAPEQLALDLTLAAKIESAVPLPGDARFWLPGKVELDGQSATPPLLRQGNALWLRLPAGRHSLHMQGRLAPQATVSLPLPMLPQHLTVKAEGWEVAGIRPDGRPESQLQFKRLRDKAAADSDQVLETVVLPPFLKVERTLLLGLAWKIETRVTRLSPPGAPVVMELPLLPGESVSSEGIQSRDGKVQVNLAANQNTLSWQSFLERTDHLVLHHAETGDWTEIWRVDVSPIYHLEYEGIPVILHQQGERWFPTWHPWPGEEVSLDISRPEGVAGQTLTIDKAQLAVSPGRRATDATLTLNLRSSQGGQHTIVLPPEAKLQEVKIKGRVQPIRQEGRNVPLPITPGAQEVSLQWREPAGIAMLEKTPEIDLGVPSANLHLDLTLPASRWPLLVGGPRLGPAVLFWSVLLVLALAAFGLARTGLTPLKFHQWLLLGIGMSQSNIYGALLVVGWLIGLELRGKVRNDIDPNHFNALQIGLTVLTLLALGALVGAVSRGLLGHPDMNIVGNGSSSAMLRWYQDVSPARLPRAWLLSIPMYYYRLAMLAWALWLSFALIGVVKWGWNRFSSPAIWYKPEKKAGPPRFGGNKDKAAKDKAGELPDLTDEMREE